MRERRVSHVELVLHRLHDIHLPVPRLLNPVAIADSDNSWLVGRHLALAGDPHPDIEVLFDHGKRRRRARRQLLSGNERWHMHEIPGAVVLPAVITARDVTIGDTAERELHTAVTTAVQ